jgi:hypothetical protein
MKPYVGYVRLMNGENIIGFILKEDSTSIEIERPLSIVFEPDEKNALAQGVLMFFPWLPVSAVDVDAVELSNSKYLFCMPVSSNLVSLIEKYMKQCYELRPARYQDMGVTPSSGSNLANTAADPFTDLETLIKKLSKGTDPKDPK